MNHCTMTLNSPKFLDVKVSGTHPLKTAKGGAPLIYVGVEKDLKGWATRPDPIGGTASPAEHINGNTNSPFTSWTSDPSVAARFAGEDGVVMFKVFNASDLIDSTQVPGTNIDQWEPEFEYLVTGRVSGATVVKK